MSCLPFLAIFGALLVGAAIAALAGWHLAKWESKHFGPPNYYE